MVEERRAERHAGPCCVCLSQDGYEDPAATEPARSRLPGRQRKLLLPQLAPIDLPGVRIPAIGIMPFQGRATLQRRVYGLSLVLDMQTLVKRAGMRLSLIHI